MQFRQYTQSMSIFRRFRPWIPQINPSGQDQFEGWYFKMTTPQGHSCALIPGISTSRKDPHSFVQYIDSHGGRTAYLRYSRGDFQTRDKPFQVRVGPHIFQESGIILEGESGGAGLKGEISFGPWTPYPSGFLRPGIMGPFGLPGFLECYHGVVSAGHSLRGSLRFSTRGESTDWDLEGGKGYIEKDWGSSFPKDYVWIQANQFPDPEVSVFASLAAIPFRSWDFPGHIAFVHLAGQGFLTFATWNGSKVRDLTVTDLTYRVLLEKGPWTLEISARQTAAGSLQAPVSGSMDRVIKESVDGELEYTLSFRGTKVSSGFSPGAGLEQGGSPQDLAQWFRTGQRREAR